MPGAGRPWLAAAALAALLLVAACGREDSQQVPAPPSGPAPAPPPAAASPVASAYDGIRDAIRRQQATPGMVTEALAEPNRMGLANTIHSLHFMRETPWVASLLRAIWTDDRDAHPDLDWLRLQAPAARVAVAVTLARSDPAGAQSYLPYIRSCLTDPDPFVRAQAAVGVGFVGTGDDIERLTDLARAETAYDAEAAIKALGIHGSQAGRAALLALAGDPAIDPRRQAVARQILVEAYPDSVPGAGRGRLAGSPPAE